MVKFIIDSLKNNNQDLQLYYQNAHMIWAEVFDNFDWHSPTAVKDLAQIMTAKQLSFEQIVNDTLFGMDLMVMSAIAYYYDNAEGYGENRKNASIILEAFQESYIFAGIKDRIKIVGRLYV